MVGFLKGLGGERWKQYVSHKTVREAATLGKPRRGGRW